MIVWKRIVLNIFLFFSLTLGSSLAHADWEIFPESRHHLYQSYSFFIEQQNMLAWTGGDRYWATVAANLPLIGNNDSPIHPQLVFSISGNDSMHVDGSGGVFTESLDTRIGLAYEFQIPGIETKLSLGYQHESGHVADGDSTPSLAPLNLGYNTYRIRLVQDFAKKIRAGFTIIPISHAIPDDLLAQAEEFIEYFPWASNENKSFSPFVSASLQHQLEFSSTPVTFNAEIGIAKGNHFDSHHTGDLRLVVGYYNGQDPRAKYSGFLNATATFGYTALMFGF